MTAGTCLNCGAALSGPFCAACGQRVRRADPTLAEFLADTTEQVTNWDGRIPVTLRTLFLKPGTLTLDFLQGRRARWLAPLRLYLICSIAYFASVPMIESITHRQSRQLVRMGVTMTPGVELTPEDRAELDSSVVTRWIGRERLDRILANGPAFNAAVARSFPKVMFILLPLFALLTSMAWRKAAPHYPAHLYFALHEHAAGFGALTIGKLATLGGNITLDIAAGVTALLYIAWHAFRASRVVFGGSFGATVLKFTAVAMIYWAFVILATLGLIVYAFVTV